jgi:hypothetical protein
MKRGMEKGKEDERLEWRTEKRDEGKEVSVRELRQDGIVHWFTQLLVPSTAYDVTPVTLTVTVNNNDI